MEEPQSIGGDRGPGVEAGARPTRPASWHRPGWRRSLQLGLATVWLLDGVLQLQPMMFGHGPGGLGSMLDGAAAGNPGPVASSIRSAAGVVDHHAAAANALVALVQLLIGLGIAWRPTVKPALAGSVAWSLVVWWFGEGLGGMLHGTGSPVAGGPGPAVLYAVAALALWPPGSATSDRGTRPVPPFAAAGMLGAPVARAVWAVGWCLLGVLCVVGSARSPWGIAKVIRGTEPGQPGWLAALDRQAASLVGGHGAAVAAALCLACVVVAAGVYLPPPLARVTLVVAVVLSVAMWVVTQGFGQILAGGATDPDSGPLLVLLALAYWPRSVPVPQRSPAPSAQVELAGVTP